MADLFLAVNPVSGGGRTGDEPERWDLLRRRLGRLTLYVVALGVMLIVVVPLLFSVLGGFRSNKQLVESPVGLPDPWIFSNYSSLISSWGFWRQPRPISPCW